MRDMTKAGYLIRNLGTSVQVCRPGEADPSFIVPTVPEALMLIDVDQNQAEEAQIHCPGCQKDACGCLA